MVTSCDILIPKSNIAFILRPLEHKTSLALPTSIQSITAGFAVSVAESSVVRSGGQPY